MMYNPSFLIKLVQAKMPFGKYERRYITSLPVSYLEWFSRKGWPPGELGQFLATMYEIRINGIEEVLLPIIREYRT